MIDLKRRAARMAETSSLGPELVRYLESKKVLARLLDAADAGDPPLGAVAADLERDFPGLREDTAARRVVGTLISAILDEQGYEVAARDVRLPRGTLFERGAAFRRKAAAAGADVLTRVADALTEDEAVRVIKHLRRRFPRLRSA